MKPKHAVLSLLVIVVIFVSKGFHANYVVQKDMENVYKEFDTVTNTLSPLFDTYGLSMVDSQVKASHGLITAHEYCEQLEKAVATQKKKIQEYSEMVKGNESLDDKELFMRSTDAYIYANKMMGLCKKNDIEAIHQSLYSGEMYKIIDPMTGCINRILNNKFETSETYRKDALRAIKHHNDVMIFASVLTVILAIVIVRHDDCRSKRVDKKRKKSRVRRL
jgi:CHASE3 domain sensor protein